MKKIRLSFIIFSLLFAFTLISSSGGRATAAGEGNTGAPGDNIKVCATCHSGGNFSPTVDIVVKSESDMMEISEYTPGVRYIVEVDVATQNAASAYGFQMVSLLDTGDLGIDGWSDPSSNTKIVSAGGRSYAEQTGPSSSSTFSVKWTAPASGSGSVSFYASGNAVNLNGSPTGDQATESFITINEGETSPTFDISFDDKSLTIYPNPTDDLINLKFEDDFKGRFTVHNILGNKIAEWDIENGIGCVQVKDQLSGTYIINVFNEDNIRVATRKVIKI